MCGIIGILGIENVVSQLIFGLKRLEYRGYDSAGLATLVNGRIERRRAEGKIERLEAELNSNSLKGDVGIGHTRWATHGAPNKVNAHPHATDRVAVVHNGIIENFQALRLELASSGYNFESDTDTEVILASYLKWGEQCQFKFRGAWAFAIWDNKEKNLFLSSDRFGTIPLYYKRHKNYFIFASELKAFMSLQSIFTPEFDYGFFLWLGKNHGCLNTFLKDIFILPGGHQININQKVNSH